MRLMNRDTDYAIKVLSYMAYNQRTIFTAAALQKALKIPYRFLRKILQQLNKKKLLVSYKGLGGGFQLARNGEDITIVEVIEAFQGKLQLNRCLFNKRLCSHMKACILRDKINSIEQNMISELSSITVASLAPGYLYHIAASDKDKSKRK